MVLLFIVIIFLGIFTYTFLKVNPNPIWCHESTLRRSVPGSHTLIWWLSFFMTQLTKSRDRSYKRERCAQYLYTHLPMVGAYSSIRDLLYSHSFVNLVVQLVFSPRFRYRGRARLSLEFELTDTETMGKKRREPFSSFHSGDTLMHINDSLSAWIVYNLFIPLLKNGSNSSLAENKTDLILPMVLVVVSCRG